ncbi:MAG: hypothetical protein V3R99_13715 [Thermoguttaceae bacterium]
MPNIPQPFKMRDWRATAHAYDDFVFDPDAKGQYLPLVWIDDSAVLLVLPPSGGRETRQDGKTLVDGVVIDH